MRCICLGILLAAVLYAPAAKAQTSGNQCPGGGAQLNSVESLRALIRNEVAAQVEMEVVSRLAATPGKIDTIKFYWSESLVNSVLYS